MAYASHMQRDIQQTSSSSPVNTTLRLFGGDLGCDWEELCYPEKTMTSISSNSKTKMIGLQPVIARQIQTLASLESNYETSEDEEHIEKELGEMDQVGEEFADEEEMEDDFDEEDVNDDDEDYVDFCNFLTKSPACDAAASRFIHTSFVTSSFSFSMTNDDDSSEEEDETGDVREEDASENDSADEDEFDWSTPQTSYIGGFDPFAVSGLFMPSLLSTLAYGSPSVTDEKPCNLDNDSDLNESEVKELAQKLKDINRRWLEMYSNSKDGDSTKVDAENCITSKAIEVSCKKNVQFCDKKMFIDVLNEEEWAEDYEIARKGPWEQYHRDHVRFENRIESLREVLSRVLVAEHRATVFQKLHGTTDLVTDDQMDLFQSLPSSS